MGIAEQFNRIFGYKFYTCNVCPGIFDMIIQVELRPLKKNFDVPPIGGDLFLFFLVLNSFLLLKICEI